MKQSFALLDVGGTDIKSSIFNTDDSNLQTIYRTRTPGNIQKNFDLFEISPNCLYSEVEKHIQSIGSSRTRIEGLFISGQMGSWVVSDAKNRPITNIVSWQDNRAAINKNDFNRQVVDALGRDWLKTTGNEVRPGLPLLGLERIKNKLPLHKNLRFHTLISWIASQLATDYTYLSHITDSASTGMVDLTTNTWSKLALNFLDFDIELPEISSNVMELGFSKALSCPIYTPVGDQQASLYGAELDTENTVVNIGTGGQVAAISTINRLTNLQIRPYFNGQTIETRTHLPAGRLISKCVGKLYPEADTVEAFAKFMLKSEVFDSDKYLDAENLEKSLLALDNNDYLPSMILNTVSKAYKNALSEINDKSSNNLVFAGGIGQKFKKLQVSISEGKSYRIADSEETTLRGLMMLAKEIKNQVN